MRGINGWLQGRRNRKGKRLAFTISERISSKEYVEVPVVLDQAKHSTVIQQAFYDPGPGEIVDATPPSALPGESSE